MKGKKILLGVTGSIAAYKSASLVRLLVKEGAEVRVIMTSAAKDFITPLTLSTLSGHPVLSEYYDAKDGSWNNHVELGMWPDLFLIAPLSASTLSRMAHGSCDNLLSAVYLSARCPVMVAPAMDLDMWKHAATRENLDCIIRHGVRLIPPGVGELASGLSGEGRMEEPDNILQSLHTFFVDGRSLAGVKALVTAGPTWEAIDPVRFIGNRSSGKMGFAIAEELAARGATVTLVSGPSSEQVRHTSIRRIDVESAWEMKQACDAAFKEAGLVIMSAAVADYKPENVKEEKIKKKGEGMDLHLVATTDILQEMGRLKKKDQTLVGFALETDNELANAEDKLKRKNLDFLVLNSLRDQGAGFGHDTNKVTLLSADGASKAFTLKSKKEVAKDLVEALLPAIKQKTES
ncbi:MAG: bifunctional phosphopantothenoylcysteine decarboxylase/phosphopantothenate--cysteine ligase CoaBC [Bacteroidota bacterium]